MEGSFAMTDFESDLRGALRRREPPRDLTAGIMARVVVRRRSWWPAVAAVVLLMVTGIGEGLRAKRQLMFAVELTSQKLGSAQAKVAEVSRRRIGRD
jgi:uncharacterized membrane protein